MLNDAWFLTVMRAQIEADKRMLRPATLSTDHALRLLEMAERWHAEHDHDAERTAAEMVASWDDVPDGHSLALAGRARPDTERVLRIRAQTAAIPHKPMKRNRGESRSEHVLRIINAHNGLTSFEVTHICGGYGPHAELNLLLKAGRICAVKEPRPFRYFPAP